MRSANSFLRFVLAFFFFFFFIFSYASERNDDIGRSNSTKLLDDSHKFRVLDTNEVERFPLWKSIEREMGDAWQKETRHSLPMGSIQPPIHATIFFIHESLAALSTGNAAAREEIYLWIEK